MKCKKGFTLIELLVVIAIIALLVSILLPSLNRARELAKRAVCMTRLKGVGMGLVLYQAENNDSSPWLDYSGNWVTKSIGTSRGTAPTSSNEARSVSALMFLLIREGQGAKLFVCPSTTDTAEDDLKDSSGNYYWDFFADVTKVSYSWQAPVNNPGTNGVGSSMQSGVAIMADQTPYATGPESSPTPPTDVTNITGDNIEPYMSQNHSKGEKMNVLYAGSHVSAESRPDVGLSDDNIFTSAASTDEALFQAGINIGQPAHQSQEDSFLCGPEIP